MAVSFCRSAGNADSPVMTGELVAVGAVGTGGVTKAGGWAAPAAGAVDEVPAGEETIAVPPLPAVQPNAARETRANAVGARPGMERRMEKVIFVVTRVSK